MEKGAGRMTGVVLAGGKSRRMGRDKAFLELEGNPLLSKVLRVLDRVFPSVMIVADSPERFREFRHPVVCDLIPGQGPLGGIYTGLRSAGSDAIFVTGCDFPFLCEDLIRYLSGLISGYDAVVPRCNDQWHPSHAVYSRDGLGVWERKIQAGELSLKQALPDLRVRKVEEAEVRCFDPELASLTNLNTPEDWVRALCIP